jgi:hypothetical protein
VSTAAAARFQATTSHVALLYQDMPRDDSAFVDTDMTVIVRLAADLEVDRVLQDTVAAGMSAAEKATFREMVRTATLDGAASLGLIPPPSQSRLARLDTFLMHRKAAMHGDLRATLPSSAAALH